LFCVVATTERLQGDTDLPVVIQARIGGAPAASAEAGRGVPGGVPIRAQRHVESCVSWRFVDQILVKTHLECMTQKASTPAEMALRVCQGVQ